MNDEPNNGDLLELGQYISRQKQEISLRMMYSGMSQSAPPGGTGFQTSLLLVRSRQTIGVVQWRKMAGTL